MVGEAGVIDARGWMEPRTNLTVQTRIIRGAQALFTTYGGFSYLGPFLDVPSVCFYSDDTFNPTHLEFMRRAIVAAAARHVRMHLTNHGRWRRRRPRRKTPSTSAREEAAVDPRRTQRGADLSVGGTLSCRERCHHHCRSGHRLADATAGPHEIASLTTVRRDERHARDPSHGSTTGEKA